MLLLLLQCFFLLLTIQHFQSEDVYHVTVIGLIMFISDICSLTGHHRIIRMLFLAVVDRDVPMQTAFMRCTVNSVSHVHSIVQDMSVLGGLVDSARVCVHPRVRLRVCVSFRIPSVSVMRPLLYLISITICNSSAEHAAAAAAAAASSLFSRLSVRRSCIYTKRMLLRY